MRWIHLLNVAPARGFGSKQGRVGAKAGFKTDSSAAFNFETAFRTASNTGLRS